MQGFIGMVQGLGIKPARLWAYAVAVVEFLGGLLVALGLLTPIAAIAVFANMVVAIVLVHVLLQSKWRLRVPASHGGGHAHARPDWARSGFARRADSDAPPAAFDARGLSRRLSWWRGCGAREPSHQPRQPETVASGVIADRRRWRTESRSPRPNTQRVYLRCGSAFAEEIIAADRRPRLGGDLASSLR